MTLTIGIDATSWANGRGYGRFTRDQSTSLIETPSEHRFKLYIEAANAHLLDHLKDRVEVIAVPLSEVPTEAAGAESSRSIQDMWRLRNAVSNNPCDILYFPTVYSWFPIKKSQKVLLNIHDAIAERYPELCFGNKRAQLFWNIKVKLAIRQAKLYTTTSDYAAHDLEHVLGIPKNKIRVAPIVPADVFHPRTEAEIRSASEPLGLTLNDSWFVYVGGFNPHKNVNRLIKCFAQSKKDTGHKAKLLLVGSHDKDVFFGDQAPLRALINELNIQDDVIWTGFVDDNNLAALLSHSLAVTLPSTCEGFGLPAVEGAACGAAVIVTQESPMPGLLAGGGVFIAPNKSEELREALTLMATNEATRKTCAKTALSQVRKLTWASSVKKTLSYLEEAAR